MKFENINKHFTQSEIDAITKALQAAKDVSFIETLVEIIPSPIFYKNNLGIYKFCNKAFCEYLGLNKSDIIDHTVFDIAPINLANIYHQADLDLMQSGQTQIYESQVKYQDGSLHDVMYHKTVHFDDHQNILGLVGVMVDISTQKNTERLIQRQNIIKDVLINISHIVNQNSDSIYFFNLLLDEFVKNFDHVDYATLYELESEHVRLLASVGHETEELHEFVYEESHWYIYQHACGNYSSSDVIDHLDDYLSESYPKHLLTLDKRKVNSCLYIPVHLESGQHIVIVLESSSIATFGEVDINIAEYIQVQIPIIHQIYSLNKKTLLLSRYDALTGLMNRGYFNTIFEDRLKLAARDNSKLSLAMFDLDGLKIINDNFGHAAGDVYLENFAEFIKSQFRSTDTFARIGGDEFLGIFSTTDPITLKKKLTLLQTLYTQILIESGDYSFHGRFSYGIATYPDDADTTDGLMTIADIKMYGDKKNVKK